MQLKMAKQLKKISTLAQNRHSAADTESDYDTDDLDTTLTELGKIKAKGSDRERSSFASTGSWADSLGMSLTEGDIERLRLSCPMSDSMMVSMTEADIDKLRLSSSVIDPYLDEQLKIPDIMSDSMISDTHALVDMRRSNDRDADSESSDGEGLRNFEDGATIKRKVTKKKHKASSKDNPSAHVNGDRSLDLSGGQSRNWEEANANTPTAENCDVESRTLDSSRTSALQDIANDNESSSAGADLPGVKLNGAVCNGQGNAEWPAGGSFSSGLNCSVVPL